MKDDAREGGSQPEGEASPPGGDAGAGGSPPGKSPSGEGAREGAKGSAGQQAGWSSGVTLYTYDKQGALVQTRQLSRKESQRWRRRGLAQEKERAREWARRGQVPPASHVTTYIYHLPPQSHGEGEDAREGTGQAP